jgi:hypothetical protein
MSVNNPQSASPPQFSADGRFWWDGARWQPAVSPDGLWRWNGTQWIPAAKPGRKIGVGGAFIIAIALVLIVWFWLPAAINFVRVLVQQP